MREQVRDYYGDVLQSSGDLKSDACCEISAPEPHIRDALTHIHPEVANKYYGCGLIAPDGLKGKRVLDLGCGTGRDVFLLAQLVGESGEVVGVDMTDNQLAVALEHEAWHADRFGYARPNTRFLKGYIEDLDQLDLELGSFDLIISNCVINLSTDKPAVFAGVRHLLKPDGVMHFADVYAERAVPEALRTDPVLYGECLAGALAWSDFLAIAEDTGFDAPELVDHRPLAITDEALIETLDGLKFVSATVELRTAPANDAPRQETGDPFTLKSPHAPSSGSCCG
ncbi:methyltransferase domain-containing protein [Oceanicaulis alexandrii]|uniref:methyltransferase domain-containing protein n=1 Tax=Oceanicaulis alexandrii TaxID=153233 RepID=UPI0035CFD41C